MKPIIQLLFIVFISLIALLSGCAPDSVTTPPIPPTPHTASPSPILPTFTPQPTATETPIPSPTPLGADNGEFFYISEIPENNLVYSLTLFSSSRGQLLSTSQLADKFKIEILRHGVQISPNSKKIVLYLCKGSTIPCDDTETYLATDDLSMTIDLKSIVSTSTTTKPEDLGYVSVLSWSPDSSYMVLKGWRNGRGISIYTMGENGKSITRLNMIDPNRATEPFWSSNSEQLYWQESARRLNAVNINGSDDHSIPLNYPGGNFHLMDLEFSKDGAKAALIGHVGNDYFVHITDGSFTKPIVIKLPELSGEDWTSMKFRITWSLDNEYLFIGNYYNTMQYTEGNVNYKINVTTGDIEKLDVQICGLTPNHKQLTFINKGNLFIADLSDINNKFLLITRQQLHFPYACPIWRES